MLFFHCTLCELLSQSDKTKQTRVILHGKKIYVQALTLVKEEVL